MSGNPICRDTACAMNKSGQCCALRDNTFKNRARCPFFKTKEQIDAELEARRERLRAESVLEDCRRAAVEYRARFGAYPASAEALAACGFRYDAERYRIRYTYYGEQIFPGIGLYRKGAAG